MFLGEYTHTLDDKGRLTLPAKFRGQLAGGVIVTRGLDGCLFVFTKDSWVRFTDTLAERLPFTQQKARALSRFLYSSASDVTPDRQGRILVPPSLRRYAGLNEEVMILTIDNREAARGPSPGLLPVQPQDALNVGRDELTAAGDYEPPNPLQGQVSDLRIEARSVND